MGWRVNLVDKGNMEISIIPRITWKAMYPTHFGLILVSNMTICGPYLLNICIYCVLISMGNS